MSEDTPTTEKTKRMLDRQVAEAVGTLDWLVAADNFRAICHAAAGVECKACGGGGTRCYGSTSTWRGGIAGQAMTWGTCDVCWGSGRTDAPGPNLRELEHRARKAETMLGATSSSAWLARQMGVTIHVIREHLPEVITKIRGMRMSGFWAAAAARRLADALDVLQRETDVDASRGAPVGPATSPTDPTK